ncbi:MAG: response regulator [Thiobacillus sp.]|nr:response regulator [Thiobacillus sp.]
MSNRDRLRYVLSCALGVLFLLYLFTAEQNFISVWAHPRMTALHTLLELFAITVASMVVTSAWYTFNRGTGRHSQIFIVGFTVVVVCDVFHVLTYPGMQDFLSPSGLSSTLFYWLVGRSVEVLTVSLVAISVLPRMSRWLSLGVGVSLSAAIVVFGTLFLDSFPQTYIAGVGLTPFKITYELILFTLNLMLAVALQVQAQRQGSRVLSLMSLSSLFMGLGSLAFTSYQAISDIQNLGGHAFKIAAYALLFRAVFISNMTAPFLALKASERENREFREVMKTLGANLHNSVIFQVLRKPGGRTRFTQVSESIERINGIKAEDLYRDPTLWKRLIVQQDRGLYRATERMSLEAMMKFDTTVRMACPDGRERRMHFVAAPRKLTDGTVVWDGLATDVTEQYQTEARRRKLEAELNQAQKMESIGTLASGIAHDFNNVLAAIIGNTQMVIEDVRHQESAEALQGLSQIQKSATRAKALVNQILSFSRKEAPVRTLQPVRPIIEESLSLLRTTIPSNVAIDERFDDDNTYALMDSTQIQQVLVNLCTNSWHAIGERCGRIGIHTSLVDVDSQESRHSSLLPGRYVRIRVEDDGCGMDSATLQRLYEPFFTTKPPGVGTGLGMPVVHRIVTSHDGHITVDSSLGGGTRFDIYIPGVEAIDGVHEESAPIAHPKVMGNGERVLYVDDDPLMSQMVDRMLTRARFKVRVVNDPHVAVELLQKSALQFDVLVTDYNMPGLTGLQVIEAARHLREDLPVILLSGYVSEQLRQAGKRQGVGFVMEKQKSLEELSGAIERALEAYATEKIQ